MLDDLEQYEIECEKIKESNVVLLSEFANWLRDSGLSDKTVKTHIDNIDFYINVYLLAEDATTPQEGIEDVDMFLGYWFIKKAMWASAASIKSNVASLKKFYRFLQEREMVDKESLDSLLEIIKEEMPSWLETLERYDDSSITDMEEVWGF